MKIHKIGKQKAIAYIWLGTYEEIPTPLCVGAKAIYDGRKYLVHSLKAKITCKHCLKILNKNLKIY